MRLIVSKRASEALISSTCRRTWALKTAQAAAASAVRAGLPAFAASEAIARRVERQERHDVRPAVADRHRLRDGRDLLQPALEVLGRDVLAPGGDQQLLAAVRHAQEAVVVDLADVARVEPALGVQGLLARGRVAVVALEDVRAADQDLAVVRDPQLRSRDRIPGPAEAVALGEGQRRGPRALAHAEELHDRQAQALEEVERLLGDRGRGDDEHAGLVEAEPRADLREDELVGDPVAPGPARAPLIRLAARAPDAARPGHDPPPKRARLRPCQLDARLDLLPHARHAEEEMRPDLAQVLGHLLDALREVDAGPGGERQEHGGDLLGDVRERQVADQPVARSDGQELPRTLGDEDEIAVREHDALRRAGRTRGVDERADVVAAQGGAAALDLRRVRGRAPREQLVPGQLAGLALGRGAFLRLAFEQHDAAQARGRPARGREPLEGRAAVDDRDLRVRVLGDVAALLGRRVGVDAGRERADRHRREIRDVPLGPVRREDHDAAARLDAERDEPACGLIHDLAELGPVERLPAAAALAGQRRQRRVGARRRCEDLEDGLGHVAGSFVRVFPPRSYREPPRRVKGPPPLTNAADAAG